MDIQEVMGPQKKWVKYEDSLEKALDIMSS